jgi:hypothetical protein
MGKIKIDVKPDHVDGGFEREKNPDCKCGQLAQAIKDKIIFVSNNVNIRWKWTLKRFILPISTLVTKAVSLIRC